MNLIKCYSVIDKVLLKLFFKPCNLIFVTCLAIAVWTKVYCDIKGESGLGAPEEGGGVRNSGYHSHRSCHWMLPRWTSEGFSIQLKADQSYSGQ